MVSQLHHWVPFWLLQNGLYERWQAWPPCVHLKICKVPQSSKQKLQRKIGQMSDLKCIPGDTFSSLSLWPSSSPLSHRSCLSLHFISNCISWPDAGPNDDSMDPHLPLFRIGELKTLNVEILSSYSNSLASWQTFWQNIGLNQDIKCDTEMVIEKISMLLKPRQ